jgi:TfoX/Sxy family transcriptional regulator of competence genes
MPMQMPKSSSEAADAFRALVPHSEAVKVKPMFGHLAAFVNGNMFAGVFGDDLFVRVGDDDRAAILAAGGRDFEPVAGRPMRGYVVLGARWREDPGTAERWVGTALAATSTMPAKLPKAKKG